MSVTSKVLQIPEQLPFLAAISWQLADYQNLAPEMMLRQYERNWHYRGVLGDLTAAELAFVQQLSQQYGSWLSMNFSADLHQKILVALNQFNADFLQSCGVYFGGGTLLALMLDEYRISQDIDFLCSSGIGYQQLRQAVFDRGYQALFHDPRQVNLPREIQANQYGVRFPVVIDDYSIKVEIVAEGRIQLDFPEQVDWLPVACLNFSDRIAEKLLANADRWLDSSTASRDLIDLAMLRSQAPLPAAAIAKAEAAYPVVEPLKRSIVRFQAHPAERDRCYQTLQVRSPNQIINGLDQLALDFNLPHTSRTTSEFG